MNLQDINDALGRWSGFSLKRYQYSFDDARRALFSNHQITRVLDCGANQGQWTARFKSTISPLIRIDCFEPHEQAVSVLRSRYQFDQTVTIHHTALSDFEGTAKLFLSSNSGMSSSLLSPRRHLTSYPSISFNTSEICSVSKLDSYFEPGQSYYLKLDVQGSELNILSAANQTLQATRIIEIELSLTGEMYELESTPGKVLNHLEKHGFRVYSLSDTARSSNGNCSYIDALLENRN